MPIGFKAGEFSVEAWTEGYPIWVTIKHGARDMGGIHHSELRDLAYVIERMIASVGAKLPDGHRHEVD